MICSIGLTAQERGNFNIVVRTIRAGQIIEPSIKTAAIPRSHTLTDTFGDGRGRGLFRLFGMTRDALKHPAETGHAALTTRLLGGRLLGGLTLRRLLHGARKTLHHLVRRGTGRGLRAAGRRDKTASVTVQNIAGLRRSGGLAQFRLIGRARHVVVFVLRGRRGGLRARNRLVQGRFGDRSGTARGNRDIFFDRFLRDRRGLGQRLAHTTARGRDFGHRSVDAGRHDRNADRTFHLGVEGRTDDDIGIGIDFLADLLGRLVHLEQVRS